MIDPTLTGFSAMHWVAMVGIALVAGLVHGFVGIGFPLFATPLFGLMFGWTTAVTVLVLPTWAVCVVALWAFRGRVDRRAALRTYWPLGVTMPIGLLAGVHALHVVPADRLMVLMASVMIVYLLLDRLGRTDLPAARAHPSALAVPFGLAAGFSEGALNVAGPLMLIYFLLLEVPVAATIALLNILFLMGKSLQALLMAQRGAFGVLALQALVPVAVAGIAGYLTGLRLRARFDPSRYRTWLKATLALMAAALLLRVAAGGVH